MVESLNGVLSVNADQLNLIVSAIRSLQRKTPHLENNNIDAL